MNKINYILSLFILLSACKDATLDPPNIQILSVDSQPVLSPGPAGTWDDIDVLNPSVVIFNKILINFYSGWDGSIWRTGYATSIDNGLSWEKRQNPVLDLGAWDKSYIAANGSAIVINNTLYYYFHGLNGDGHAEIGLATSSDGINFSMLQEPILTIEQSGSWDDLHVADPYAVSDGTTLFMYFTGANDQYIERIGVATSADGISWHRHNGEILDLGADGEFDGYALGEPSVIFAAPYYYMIYTGTNVSHQRTLGWAYSTDGINWIKKGQLLSNDLRQSWDSQVMCDPTILDTGHGDGTYYVWFGGGDLPQDAQNLNGHIGRLTIKLN